MLIDRIAGAKNGSQSDMLFLIEKFTPLIKHYGYKLHTEDAVNDLTYEFIKLIHNINIGKMQCNGDGAVVNYISVSLKNAYKALLRKLIEKKDDWVSWDELTEKEKYSLENDRQNGNVEDDLMDFLLGFPSLTTKEKQIIVLIYQYGYTSTEIATRLQTTKQNVNQIKLRAQKKIKKRLLDL